MSEWHGDEVIAWHCDQRGRPVRLEGAIERRRIGPLTRFLLPDLDGDFAAPGDVVRLYRLPVRGTPTFGMVNFARGTFVAVPPGRRLAVICTCWAVAAAADLRWAMDGWLLLAGFIAALPAVLALRSVARRAEAEAHDEDLAYRVRVYWRILRHSLAPDAPPRAEPPADPPDWPARLAASYAGALESHQWHPIANLPVPDGRLTACDPYEIGEKPGNVVEVPPGVYPVILAVGSFGPPSSGLFEARVVHAWVQLRDSPAARWEPVAGPAGERLSVGVDSGLASFSSASAAPALRGAFDDGTPHAFSTRLEEVLEEKMADEGWAVVEANGASMVVFPSGYGDGFYDVYRGLDEAGEAVAIAIDFKVAGAIYFA